MTKAITDDRLWELLSSPLSRNEGFRLLMQQYGNCLYWHIRRIVVGHDDAEDAMQDACLQAWRSLDSFRGNSSLRTWLYSIATNEALQTLRRRKRFLQRMDTLGPLLAEKMQAETSLDEHSAAVLFQQALLQLPTRQRIAFNLRYYDELSYEDISSITGSSVGTLKTNYHYAVKRIKTYLQEHAL